MAVIFKMLKGKDLLKYFQFVAPYLKEIIAKDIVVTITDRENFIAYYPGDKLDIGTKVGRPLQLLDPLNIAMQQRKTLLAIVPKEIAGITFKGIMTPIFDDSDIVVGCIGIGVSMELETEVTEMAKGLKISLEQSSSSTQQLSISAGEINCFYQNLSTDINKIINVTTEINQVLSFIKTIAMKTKILGLNASIEAARAGENGLGFSVVAKEIKRLSGESVETISKIKLLTKKIEDAVKATQQSSEQALKSTKEQVSATEQITFSIEQLAHISEKLELLSKNL